MWFSGYGSSSRRLGLYKKNNYGARHAKMIATHIANKLSAGFGILVSRYSAYRRLNEEHLMPGDQWSASKVSPTDVVKTSSSSE
ncbi:hypothetical protein TNCV_2237091 [Trichonephila clavipes]|nr:hypothetical protein TNCV_2237091 [Trichonephila clavipes]